MATAKENLEDFITCSVCLEKFEGRDPRLLPCGHAFCLTCIQDIHRTATAKQDNKLKDGEFRCPQCTIISIIPEKSVNKFPKFFYASYIHDMIRGTNPQICHNDNREVRCYCFTCTKTFCDQCLKRHNKNQRYNNHVHVEVTKDNIQALVCTVHDEMVEAFCTDCGKAVCAQCQMAEHEDHSLSDFVIIAQPPSTQLREMNKKLEASKNEIQKLETMQNVFNAHIADVQDKITKQTDSLITQIVEQSQALQAEMASHQTETNQEIEKMKRRLKSSDDMLLQFQARMTQLTKPVPELPSASLHNMDKILSDIQQQFPQMPQIDVDMQDVPRYQFTPQTADVMLGKLTTLKHSLYNQKLSTAQKKLGRVEHKQTVPSHMHRLSESSVGTATPRTSPAAEAVPKQGPSQLVSVADTFMEPQSEWVAQPRLVTQIDPGLIHDYTWTPSGDVLLAADYYKLEMYNTRGEWLPVQCDLSGVDGIVRSVAVHQTQSTVAMVTGSSCHLRAYNHLYITSLGKYKVRRVCELPEWICQVIFTTEGDVLVCGGSDLLKYTIKGNKLWERHVTHTVNYITTTPDNKIIVCGDKQLSEHDQDGHWFSSFPRDTSTLCDPRGVCADSSGHVFVSDSEKRAVLMYTSDGTYMREVVRVDGRPGPLALYQDRYLAVEEWDDMLHQLRVYDIKL